MFASIRRPAGLGTTHRPIRFISLGSFVAALFWLFAIAGPSGMATDPGKAHVLLSRQHDLRGLVLTSFSDATGDPVARLRIDRIFVENERRGFLRIGILPVVVIQGVRLQFLSDEANPEVLKAFAEEIARVTDSARTEVRGFSFENQPAAWRIESDRLTFAPDSWRFPGSAVIYAADGAQTAQRAAIHLDGPEAGFLGWTDESGRPFRWPLSQTPDLSSNLFQPNQ